MQPSYRKPDRVLLEHQMSIWCSRPPNRRRSPPERGYHGLARWTPRLGFRRIACVLDPLDPHQVAPPATADYLLTTVPDATAALVVAGGRMPYLRPGPPVGRRVSPVGRERKLDWP
jgi:hypothetical protein